MPKKITLYKFRSLVGEKCDNVIEILETGKFHCSTYYKLNDPMEGFYESRGFTKEYAEKIFKEKNKTRICSFSRFDDGIRNHLTMPLWAYYANDFKGCVIEIEKEYDESIKKINYISSLDKVLGNIFIHTRNNRRIPLYRDNLRDMIYDDIRDIATTILTTKLSSWRHENEYRYITNEYTKDGKCEIGTIKRVYVYKDGRRNRKGCSIDKTALDKLKKTGKEVVILSYKDFVNPKR